MAEQRGGNNGFTICVHDERSGNISWDLKRGPSGSQYTQLGRAGLLEDQVKQIVDGVLSSFKEIALPEGPSGMLEILGQERLAHQCLLLRAQVSLKDEAGKDVVYGDRITCDEHTIAGLVSRAMLEAGYATMV